MPVAPSSSWEQELIQAQKRYKISNIDSGRFTVEVPLTEQNAKMKLPEAIVINYNVYGSNAQGPNGVIQVTSDGLQDVIRRGLSAAMTTYALKIGPTRVRRVLSWIDNAFIQLAEAAIEALKSKSSKSQKSSDGSPSENGNPTSSEKPKVGVATNEGTIDEKGWSTEQQAALEAALRAVPASLPPKERWKQIGDKVKGKSAGECVQRFKELRQLAQENQKWSDEQQKQLEKALVFVPATDFKSNPNMRWRKIAAMVDGKDAVACRERFEKVFGGMQALSDRERFEKNAHKISNEDRDIDDEKADERSHAPPVVDSEGNELLPELPDDLLEGDGLSFGASATQFKLDCMLMEGTSVACLANVRLQLACSRCRHSFDLEFPCFDDQDQVINTTAVGSAVELQHVGEAKSVWTRYCEQCKRPLAIGVLRQMVHDSNSTCLVIDARLITVVDLLPSPFVASCDECQQSAIITTEAHRSKRYSHVCRICHSHLTFGFGNIKIETAESDAKHPRHQAAVAAKSKVIPVAVPEGPLPENGSCKHYRKSFRWLRFPCCGKAYACDDCHNEHESHIAEWANRMICGFCGKEQGFSQKPCSCGHSLAKSGSSTRYWEGGKGCRNRKSMSNKDNKKFAGLYKTKSRKSTRGQKAKH